MPIETLRYERDCLRKVRAAHLIHDKAKWKNRLLLLRPFARSLSLRLDEDRIVSHDAPRFMLYFHCVRDISKWSVIFSTREMHEHRSARWMVPNIFRFSNFCFWDYRAGLYSLSLKGELLWLRKALQVFHWSVENYLCAQSHCKHEVYWDSATDKLR